MLILVAGPYSAPDAAGRAANLARMNEAAVAVAMAGHIPVIGVNAALPVLDAAGLPPNHAWMMEISLALASRCDGCLLIASSPGADREAATIAGLGRPVWRRIEDLPPAG
jgi:hypothetical protein